MEVQKWQEVEKDRRKKGDPVPRKGQIRETKL